MRHSVRKVIDGRVYDTETADYVWPIARVSGSYRDDFNAEATDLYLTKKGRFFLAGIGGACSRWAERTRDGRFQGQGIQVVIDAEAKQILEQANGPVELYFEVEEG